MIFKYILFLFALQLVAAQFQTFSASSFSTFDGNGQKFASSSFSGPNNQYQAISVFTNGSGTYVADSSGIFRLKPDSSQGVLAKPAVAARPPAVSQPVAARPVSSGGDSNGQYKPDNSGKYMPDNRGKY